MFPVPNNRFNYKLLHFSTVFSITYIVIYLVRTCLFAVKTSFDNTTITIQTQFVYSDNAYGV